MARQLRYDVLDITAGPGGHVSSAFSAVEILTAMYFGGVMRYRPEEPDWPERDRFLLSKGHAAPVFYPVLARAGYVPHGDDPATSASAAPGCTAIRSRGPSPASRTRAARWARASRSGWATCWPAG